VEREIAEARAEEIEDEEPWYGDIPELRGVRATGRTGAECCARPADALDGRLVVRLRRGPATPPPCEIWLEPEAGAAVMNRTWSLIDSTAEHQDGGSDVKEIANGAESEEIYLLMNSNRDHKQTGMPTRAESTV